MVTVGKFVSFLHSCETCSGGPSKESFCRAHSWSRSQLGLLAQPHHLYIVLILFSLVNQLLFAHYYCVLFSFKFPNSKECGTSANREMTGGEK